MPVTLDSDCMRCSVVVPVYNKARYIADSLSSVLQQRCDDFEVVLIDDGSTDGSADMVRSFGDPRVHVHSQTNAGVSAARNAGIARARGDLVFFFDADDWMHPDYLRVRLEQARRFPQVAFFATRFLRFSADVAVPPPWELAEPAVGRLVDDLPAAWRKRQTFITSSVAIRRDTLLAMQPCFPPGESKGEDMDLWFRVAERGPLCMTDVPLVGYREGSPGSLSLQQAEALFPPYLQRMEERARAGAMSASVARSSLRFVAEARTTQARVLLAQGRRLAGVRYLAKASAAAGRPRSWLSWLMAASFPANAIARWEQSRILRTQARR